MQVAKSATMIATPIYPKYLFPTALTTGSAVFALISAAKLYQFIGEMAVFEYANNTQLSLAYYCVLFFRRC